MAEMKTFEEVERQIVEIKTHMPAVYQSIQNKADNIGKLAYSLVRRGVRGEPNCFYAFERGRVVGTPFAQADMPEHAAVNMVRFGVAHVVVWANIEKEPS